MTFLSLLFISMKSNFATDNSTPNATLKGIFFKNSRICMELVEWQEDPFIIVKKMFKYFHVSSY